MVPRRTLAFAPLVALTFFCVAGGAYGMEDAVGSSGPLLALAAILVVPWLWSFPIALMTAELSTAMPQDGGYVVWVERAFGRFWGFQEGWLSWISILVNSAGVAVLIPFSFEEMVEIDVFLYALALLLEFGALIWLRVKEPDMERPYRVPFGVPGVIAVSLPPFLLCLASMALTNNPAKLASAAGAALGLIVYGFRRREKDSPQAST